MYYPCSNCGKITHLHLKDVNINPKSSLCFECYKGQHISIIVNGNKIITIKNQLSYFDVICMVHSGTITENTCYSITYKNANETKSEGILSKDKIIKIKDGTIISAYITNNA